MSELTTLILGLVIGWFLCEFRLRMRISAIMDRLEEDEENATIKVKLEKHGDTIIVFDKSTEIFVTQVKSKQEFYEYCETNFRGRIVIMNKEDHELLESL